MVAKARISVAVQIILPYSQGDANVHPPNLIHDFPGPRESAQLELYLDRFIHFCQAH